jgi:hypothetical protein
MKNISVIGLVCFMLSAVSLAGAQSLSKCFRADWLQGERAVNLTINGSKVAGTFIVRGSDDATSADKEYKFTGTRRGNTLTVAFAGNKLPDVTPSEMKSLVWTLVQARGQERLRIKFYGKNYDTNKYETSFSYFESCAPSYAALAKTAQAVQFAKGANSASAQLQSLVGFQAMKEPATFLIKAFKGQALEIKADGCSVEVYLPNKTLYKYVEWSNQTEKTYASIRIDGMSIETLPLTGTYLVVLRKPAESMRPETVTFKVTD